MSEHAFAWTTWAICAPRTESFPFPVCHLEGTENERLQSGQKYQGSEAFTSVATPTCPWLRRFQQAHW